MNQVVVKQEKSGYQIVEAYKSLRTNLQFCGEDKKVIAVTSCTPNEGKSSVSMQLGISLAESGKRVILIDADLRKSVLLGRTKTQKSVRGLAHFLSGQATLEDVICSTNVKNFYMIYSGPFPPNPAELLGGKNFRSLLNALRKVYDYVIVQMFFVNVSADNYLIIRKTKFSVFHPKAMNSFRCYIIVRRK